MTDPSSLVPPALLRHIHLMSTYQFPKMPHFNLDILVDYLIQAPRIVRDQSPMNWMFLQTPQDNDVLLVWQPPQMGLHESSDGYVWADPEQAFSQEMRGYKVEMYVHRSGFRMPNEPMATHARRRLRLVPSSNADPNMPQPDSSLWILYYHQADPPHHYPSRSIRISDQIRHQVNERMSLQRHGQLVRKEFMLHDSASWPTINLPGNSNQAYPQQSMGYPNDVMAHMNRNQQQAYIQQQQASASQRGIGPSPSKRPRHGTQGSIHGSTTAIPAPMIPQDPSHEDEDGTVGGDYMDFLTPRDISLQRYIQHHEWLEEILESPYDTSQIVPGDLGLGRKGELESLTRDFFEAPTKATEKEKFDPKEPSRPVDEEVVVPRVGRLEPGKAEDFTKRATEKVAQINAEMEKLRRQHARRTAKLNKGHALKEAVKNLRSETIEIMNADPRTSDVNPGHSIDELAVATLGKSVEPIQDVECIRRGGLEEKTESKDSSDQDYDMINAFVFDGATDEPPTRSTPQEAATTEPVEPKNAQEPPPATETADSGEEAERAAETNDSIEAPRDASAEGWVMVNKEGDGSNDNQDPGDIPTDNQDLGQTLNDNQDLGNIPNDNPDLGDLDQFVNDTDMQVGGDTLDFIES